MFSPLCFLVRNRSSSFLLILGPRFLWGFFGCIPSVTRANLTLKERGRPPCMAPTPFWTLLDPICAELVPPNSACAHWIIVDYIMTKHLPGYPWPMRCVLLILSRDQRYDYGQSICKSLITVALPIFDHSMHWKACSKETTPRGQSRHSFIR